VVLFKRNVQTRCLGLNEHRGCAPASHKQTYTHTQANTRTHTHTRANTYNYDPWRNTHTYTHINKQTRTRCRHNWILAKVQGERTLFKRCMHFCCYSCGLWPMIGQNHTYAVYLRYFWQENHQIYGHIRCRNTVLANPTHDALNPYIDIHTCPYKYGVVVFLRQLTPKLERSYMVCLKGFL